MSVNSQPGTVGELRAAIKDLPDAMPLVGYGSDGDNTYISLYDAELIVVDDKPDDTEETVLMVSVGN